MELETFLSHLKKVKGNGGQYTALCPAHDDQNASLCISSGTDGRILVKCQAGCRTENIVAAMGLAMNDLFSPKPEKKRVAAEYLYTDADGKTLFKKIRYDPKGFSQARPDGHGGWKFDLKGVAPVLYNLPEVLRAVRDGEPVFVVEGEKDVETLRQHKKTATCNTHGAGKGKWLRSYSDCLKNASVIIIEDHDSVGKEFAQEIAGKLAGVAGSVKLIDLSKIWADIPEHADITDYLERGGSFEQFTALVEDTPEYEPPAPSRYDDRFKGTCYRIKDHRFFREYEKNGETTEQYLGNFFIVAEAETVRDNGIERDRVFQLKAVCEGREMSSEYIAAKDFGSMNFIPQTWGMSLRPAVGQNTMAYYRDSISAQARQVKQEYIYTHTGWREMNGKWAFLHAAGAIGAKDVRVELDGRLSRYCLVECGDQHAAQMLALQVLKLAPKEIVYPLVGLAFLSPLNEFLRRAGMEPSFVLYLLGITGAMKSTLAALLLSFFGNFDNKSLPSSFKDTVNSLEKQGFLLKDVLTVIDDYHPTSSRQEAMKMQGTAQAVARMYGDRTGRGRMNADGTLRGSYVPRGNAIITGEDLPDIGQSGTARNIVVEIKKGDINEAILSNLQSKSEQLSSCMAEYIKWLIPQAEILPGELKEQFIELRSQARKNSSHGRIGESIAHLQIGMLMFLQFLCETGCIDEESMRNVAADVWQVLLELAERQNKRLELDKPTTMFLSALSELLATDQAHVLDIGNDSENHSVGFIGYRDNDYLYLYAETAYKSVAEFYSRQGRNFPVGKNTLFKNLILEGVVLPDHVKNKSVRQKKINGRNHSFLWVHRAAVDISQEA